MNLTLVFVAHDLGIIRHNLDEIMVMCLGGMMERVGAKELVNSAHHLYTAALLLSALSPDPRVKIEPQILEGDFPSPLALPEGCLFSTRCPYAKGRCTTQRPEITYSSGRAIHCFSPLNN